MPLLHLMTSTNGERSLAGYSPWGHKESDTTEVTLTCMHASDPTSVHQEPVKVTLFGLRRSALVACSRACEIFPYQGSNPYLLHWEADSLLLSHQRSRPVFLALFWSETLVGTHVHSHAHTSTQVIKVFSRAPDQPKRNHTEILTPSALPGRAKPAHQ